MSIEEELRAYHSKATDALETVREMAARTTAELESVQDKRAALLLVRKYDSAVVDKLMGDELNEERIEAFRTSSNAELDRLHLLDQEWSTLITNIDMALAELARE